MNAAFGNSAMDSLAVTVPPGVGAGESVAFESPDGRSLTALVPDGLGEGDTFTVELTPHWLEEILEALTQDRFVQVLDAFADSNCESFMLAGGGSGSFTLAQTGVHQQFQRLYESRIEAYLKRHGISQEAFAEALLGTSAERNALIDSLVTVQEFARFATMMQQRALEKEMD